MMHTGVYHPPGNAYPGVYLSGQDALALADWLKATPEQRLKMASYGAGPDYLIKVLSSCHREGPARHE